MKDDDKTKEQLLEEQQNLSERLVKLESEETNYMWVEEELRLIQKINNMLNTGVDQEKVFKTIVDGIKSLYDYDSVAIHLLSKDRKHLTLKSYSADPSIARKIEELTGLTIMGYEAPLYEGSLLKEIVDTKKPVIIDDITRVLKSYTEKKSLQSMAKTLAMLTKARWGIGVPLLAGDNVVGTIGCGSKLKLTYEDAQRLANFGAQAGLAIEKQERTRELAESEVKYRSLVETAADAIISMGEDMKITLWNKAAEKIFGYSKEEAVGRPVDIIIPERYQDMHNNAVERFLKTGKSRILGKTTELEGLKKDGTLFPIELSLSVEKRIGDYTFTNIINDITERKRAEKKLQESETHLKEAQQVAHIGNWAWDLQTNELYWSKENYRIFGLPKEVAPSYETFEKNIHPEDLEFVNKSVEDTLQRKKPYDIDFRIIRPGGEERIVHAMAKVDYDETGKPLRFFGTVQDITEHKKAEEEIKRLNEFNEKIVQSMKEGVVVGDKNGVIIYLNLSAEKMLGYTKGEIIGQHWSKIISKRFLKKVEKETAKQSKGITSRYECEVIIKSGGVVHIINSASPLFEEGEFNGVLSVFTDITAEKEKEEMVRKKLMKYRLDWGRIYYADEPRPTLTLDAFLDLLGLGYLGAVLARLPPDGFRDKIHGGMPVLWLSEKAHKFSVAPEFKVLTDKIEDLLTTRRIILFQGLEYLISKHGYDNTLRFLQGLNELFYVESAVLLLSFDSRALSRQQFVLLKKEGHRVALKGGVEMPEKCLSLLKFVYDRNSAGVKPSHKEVCKRFEITRNTAKARIRYLAARELLTEKLKGRSKVLELTEQGKDYL